MHEVMLQLEAGTAWLAAEPVSLTPTFVAAASAAPAPMF